MMSSAIHISEATFDQLLEQEHLWAKIQEAEQQISPSRRPWAECREEFIRYVDENIRAKEGFILFARENDHVVGICIGWEHMDDDCLQHEQWRRIGHVQDIVVDPRVRGQGIAQMLLSVAEGDFRRRGMPFMKLTALAQNRMAIAAYERAGFVPFETSYIKKIG